MVLWFLDFFLFGNGRGLKSPYHDDKFYWLVDVYHEKRNQKNGRFYKWLGGFGAQIESFEWFTPKPGTRRKLFGYEWKPFSVTRHFLRVRVSWEVCGLQIKEYEQVRQIENDLDSWVG